MHLYDVERGNLGANAVIGGGLPAVVGAGLAFKLRDEPRVAVAFFGDGATNIGTFHESLNLAQLWKTKTRLRLREQPLGRVDAGLAALAGLGRHVEARARVRHARDQGRRPGRRGGLRRGARGARARALRRRARSSSTSRPTACTATTSATRRSTARRRTARRRPSTIRSRGCASGSALGDDEFESLDDGGARDRRGGGRVREERHRPAARRRAQERLCLRSPTARRSATRSRRRCATTRTSSSWARTSPRWAARWASRRGCSTSSAPERVRNTPISEMAIVGAGIGAAMAGHAPGRRDHVRGLPDALARADRQPGGEAPLHVGRAAEGAADDPHAGRRRLVAGRAARAAARGVARARAGAEGRLPVDARGRARPALVVDLRRQPGHLLRAPAALPGQGRGAGEARADPARQGARRARGHRRDGDRDRAARAPLARRGRSRRRRTASRSRSSTRARCSRSTRTRSSRRSRRRTAPSSRTRR